MDYYILDEDDNPVPMTDLLAASLWHHENPHRRQLADTTIGDTRISTVFGGNVYFYEERDGQPLMWETMTFEGRLGGLRRRSLTREEALDVHQTIVGIVAAHHN